MTGPRPPMTALERAALRELEAVVQDRDAARSEAAVLRAEAESWRQEAEKLASDVKLMMPAVEKSERYREALESVIEILDHDLLMLRRVVGGGCAERDEARAAARAATEDMADWRDHADRYREALERIERSASEGAAGFDGFALKIARAALGKTPAHDAARSIREALGGGDD